jgi:hypothetical protein
MLNEENANSELESFISKELDKYPYLIDKYKERGIVVCAGGHRYGRCVYVLIKHLREVGCTLPIQIWYLGKEEYCEEWSIVFNDNDNIEFIDAIEFIKNNSDKGWLYSHSRLGGWELKTFAITHCKFKEILFLDADNLTIYNPESLFDTQQYKDIGTIFWPDYGHLGPERTIWQVMGLSYNDEPEVESGQIVLDKSRVWKALVLAHWMQNNSDYFYQIVHGDKEIFHMSWKKTNTPYIMPRNLQGTASAMLQFDFSDRPLFYHNNMCKWQREDPRNEYEDIGLKLASIYDRVFAPEKYIKEYEYIRFGLDRRDMILGDKGVIIKGNARMESFWKFYNNNLTIYNDSRQQTANLQNIQDDDMWFGRWNSFEKCETALIPKINKKRNIKDIQNKDIDIRHVEMLYETVLLLPKNSNILEIGTNTGYSSSYLEAASKENECKLFLCNNEIDEKIYETFSDNHIEIIKTNPLQLLEQDKQFDHIFINSDNFKDSRCDILHIVFCKKVLPKIICIHNNIDWYSILLQYHPSYTCLIDNLNRKNEQTHRGLLIAFRDYKDYISAKKMVWRRAF